MNDSDSSLLICKSCYEKRGIIYPQLIDTEIDQSWERNLNGTYLQTFLQVLTIIHEFPSDLCFFFLYMEKILFGKMTSFLEN